ncbi:hypothetical protein EDE11_13439 [Methylomonas methanica]|uniref:Uncharacterized protein n=1 Tax=Methylomonas methanica TaxID=421 RepID=A0ABY2CGP5_METMH|nr:hypothetical protein EDE11_13439 [Methylomonas methanica]
MCDSLIEKAAPKYTMKFFFAQQSNQTGTNGVSSYVSALKFPDLPSHFYRKRQQHNRKVTFQFLRRQAVG